jgi:hypothetical protein
MLSKRLPFLDTLDLGNGGKIRLETVTPTMAEEWLKKNAPNNRGVSHKQVEKYAGDMRNHRWHVTDQCISFDSKDRLVNGQHRLHACILADEPFESLVYYGLEDEAMMVLDSGKKRTTDDNLHISGCNWPRGASTTVRRLFLGDRASVSKPYSDEQVLEFLKRHGDSVMFAHNVLPGGKTANGVTRAVVARAHIIGSDTNRLEGFGQVMTGRKPEDGDEAGRLLRDYMLENIKAKRHYYLYFMVESALLSFLNNQEVKRVKAVKKELFTIPDEGYWDKD